MELSRPPLVVAFELMGHGDSPAPDFADHPEAYSMAYACDSLSDGLERLGARRVHLCGYSLGGRTALHFAMAHPARVASLTVISASPGIRDETERRSRKESDALLADTMQATGLHAFVDEWMNSLPLRNRGTTGPWSERALREERLRQQVRGLAGSLRGAGQGIQMPLWDKLSLLRVPVLLIAGRNDGKYLEVLSAMRGLIPDARLVILDDAGHDVPSEAADELARLLSEFWRATETSHQLNSPEQ